MDARVCSLNNENDSLMRTQSIIEEMSKKIVNEVRDTMIGLLTVFYLGLGFVLFQFHSLPCYLASAISIGMSIFFSLTFWLSIYGLYFQMVRGNILLSDFLKRKDKLLQKISDYLPATSPTSTSSSSLSSSARLPVSMNFHQSAPTPFLSKIASFVCKSLSKLFWFIRRDTKNPLLNSDNFPLVNQDSPPSSPLATQEQPLTPPSETRSEPPLSDDLINEIEELKKLIETNANLEDSVRHHKNAFLAMAIGGLIHALLVPALTFYFLCYGGTQAKGGIGPRDGRRCGVT